MDTITTDSGKVYHLREAWVPVYAMDIKERKGRQYVTKDAVVKRVWVLVEVEDPIDYSGGNRG